MQTASLGFVPRSFACLEKGVVGCLFDQSGRGVGCFHLLEDLFATSANMLASPSSIEAGGRGVEKRFEPVRMIRENSV